MVDNKITKVPVPKGGCVDIVITDPTERKLLSASDEVRKKLGFYWSKPSARMSDNNATYRFVNYLDQSGLLNDNRTKNSPGWRSFSYVDCIYLELVLAMREFGVKTDTIHYFYKLFSQQYSDEKAEYLGILWLDILMCVHCGIEMEVIINSDATNNPQVVDPLGMVLFGIGATGGQIRISLSTMVNNVRERNGMSPIEIKMFFGEMPLSEDEIEAVVNMHAMKPDDKSKLVISKKKTGTLIEKKYTETINENIDKRLSSLVDEEFGSINAQVEGGKVVRVQKTAKKFIPKKN
jgi:hypothetical protein